MVLLTGTGIDLLKVSPGLVFWTTVTFLVVFIILWLFAWKPIVRALDARNEKIAEELAQSRRLREQAESLMADYQKHLDSARDQALHIIEEGKRDAEAIRHRILEDARKEAEEIHNRAIGEISQAKAKAVKELEKEVVELSVAIISKILGRDVSKEDHRNIILRELEQLKSGK
ncbi:MAG: F0F1 ATP synthase subunit B [Turneriella sp.]|nr:F0F1 ATP synthase subunit B [Leptospiraceae bacterium]MCX7633426.1 F0F1 ATP synthase subunit B [Turneriella sp.]